MIAFCVLLFCNVAQKTGNIGIKPKRYTIDWCQATKERERVENSNPVTRYLDRRVAERGWHVCFADYMPYSRGFRFFRSKKFCAEEILLLAEVRSTWDHPTFLG